MFLFFLALFIIVPLLELWFIFQVGSEIGFLPTFLLLILISLAGAALARQQGYRAIVRIQEEVKQGRMPGDSLLDGFLILSGALLLLTPGFLTDVFGLLILFPVTRRLFRVWLKKRMIKAVERRTLIVWPSPGSGGRSSGGAPGSGPAPPEPQQRRKELGK